jgi:hypothetical protein
MTSVGICRNAFIKGPFSETDLHPGNFIMHEYIAELQSTPTDAGISRTDLTPFAQG